MLVRKSTKSGSSGQSIRIHQPVQSQTLLFKKEATADQEGVRGSTSPHHSPKQDGDHRRRRQEGLPGQPQEYARSHRVSMFSILVVHLMQGCSLCQQKLSD